MLEQQKLMLYFIIGAIVLYTAYRHFKKDNPCGEFGCCNSLGKCPEERVMKDKKGTNCDDCNFNPVELEATSSGYKPLMKTITDMYENSQHLDHLGLGVETLRDAGVIFHTKGTQEEEFENRERLAEEVATASLFANKPSVNRLQGKTRAEVRKSARKHRENMLSSNLKDVSVVSR